MTTSRHDIPPEIESDLGPGQAGFAIACLVLAVTLGMGVLAVSQLTSEGSLVANRTERALAAQTQQQARGQVHTVSATSAAAQR